MTDQTPTLADAIKQVGVAVEALRGFEYTYPETENALYALAFDRRSSPLARVIEAARQVSQLQSIVEGFRQDKVKLQAQLAQVRAERDDLMRSYQEVGKNWNEAEERNRALEEALGPLLAYVEHPGFGPDAPKVPLVVIIAKARKAMERARAASTPAAEPDYRALYEAIVVRCRVTPGRCFCGVHVTPVAASTSEPLRPSRDPSRPTFEGEPGTSSAAGGSWGLRGGGE